MRFLLSRVPPGLLVWSCMLLIILVGHLTNVPEICGAFLALPLLVLLPQRFGGLVVRAARRLVRGLPFASDIISEWFISWLVGTSSLTMVALLLQMFSLPVVIKNLPWIVLWIVVMSLGYDAVKGYYNKPAGRSLPSALRDGKVILVLLLIALVPVLIYRYFGAFPLIRDGFGLPKIVVQPPRRMVAEGYIMWNMAHNSALVVLIAMVSALVNVDALAIVWTMPFLLYVVYTLGFYLWAHELSRSKVMSVLVALVGVFLMSAAHSFETVPLRSRSSTVQLALFPFLLFLLQKNVLKRDYRLGDMFLALGLVAVAIGAFFAASISSFWIGGFSVRSNEQVFTLLCVILPFAALLLRSTILARNQARSVFLFLFFLTVFSFQFAVFEAPAFLAVILAYVALLCLVRRSALRPLFRLCILLVWLLLILWLAGLLKIPEAGRLSSALTGGDFAGEGITLSMKNAMLEQAHGRLVLVLLVLGTLFMFLSGGQTELFIVSMVTLTFFLYYLPEGSAWRFHKQIVPFMAYVLAWILYKPFRVLHRRLPVRTRFLAILAFVLAVATVVPGLVYTFYRYYSEEPLADGSYPSIMADHEHVATDWLRANASERVRLVSDYYTMQVMSELADKITIISLRINPSELSEREQAQLWHIKNGIFAEADAQSVHNAIYELVGTESDIEKDYLVSTHKSLTDVSFAVVLSGRTSRWITNEDLFQVRYGDGGDIDVDPMHLHKFCDLRYFDLLHQVGERIYIFEVKPTIFGAEGSAKSYVSAGNLYWSQGDTREAIGQYEKAIEVDALESEGYIALGEAYRAQGDFAEAGAAFREAARLTPDDVNLQMALGEMSTREGDLPGAVEAYQKAIALRPDLRDPHVALGRVYLQQGAPESAVAQFEEAMGLYSKDAELHADLGVAYAALGRLAEAAAEYQQAIELGIEKPGYDYSGVDSLTAEMLYALHVNETEYITVEAGQGLGAQLATDPAFSSLLYEGDGYELHKVAPGSRSKHVVTGYIYLLQQEWDSAIVEFNEALQVNPDAGWAHVGLGRAYQAQGQLEQALAEYRKAIAADSVSPDSGIAQAISRHLDTDPKYLLAYLAQEGRYRMGQDADLDESKWAVYSFLDNPGQDALPGDSVGVSAFVISGQPRGVLVQHPPSEISYPLEVPTPACLRFGLALAPEVWQLGRGDGVQFDIYVEDGNVRWHPFSEYIDPKNVPAHRQWNDREIDLSRWTGQAITITLATGPGPDGDSDYDWAGWGEPRLVQPISYDFLTELPSADRGGADEEQVRQDALTIDYEPRAVLFQHPTNRVTYHPEITERAELHFGLGMDPAVWSPDKGDGAEYNIYVRKPDEPQMLHRVFHRYLDPKNNPADRRWQDQVVDLSVYSGQTVDIIFEALPGPAGDNSFDWGGWSRPVLLTGPSTMFGTDFE